MVDLTALYNRKITGIERYGIEFYFALKQTKHKIIPLFRVENTIDDNENAIIIKSKGRFVCENIILSKTIRKLNPDLAFFPIFPPPIDIYFFNDIKIVPTIHDLTFKYFYTTLSFKAKIYLVNKYILALKYSTSIITISESVKNELFEYTSKSVYNWGENISMDFNIKDDFFDKSILCKYDIEKGKYIISVSTLEPRKNTLFLLKIFERIILKYPYLKLVLVGRIGWGVNSELKKYFCKLKKYIVFTDYVDIHDLRNLYFFSSSFILLSKYEGFGRTPLEAYLCRAKVIVSDIPIFKETLNNLAYYVDITNIEVAVKQIESYLRLPHIEKSIRNNIFEVLDNKVINEIDELL